MRYTLIIFLFIFSSWADQPLINPDARFHPVSSKNGMVVSQDGFATDAAVAVLKSGGNAADAAVALAYTLAVTLPKAGNIGGGGFALYFEASTGKTYAIDFRETAPASATKDMFLDKAGEVVSSKSKFSLDACGVPGTVAGLQYLSEKFGKLKHTDMLGPAIKLAEEGFSVSAGLAYDFQKYRKMLSMSPEVMKIFYPQGKTLEQGDILKQDALAKTLRALQKEGPNSFYTGSVAKLMADYFSQNGGAINAKDLADYKVRVMPPVKGTYRGHEVLSMPPPSSGGVHIIQMLNILENWDLSQSGHNTAQTVHYLTESMKRAYADRSKFLGDPDFVDIPVSGLLSKKYSNDLARKISTLKATPSTEVLPGKPAPYESPDTTHFSIADKEGNVISLTYTINFSFGSRIIIPGLGFILNNEMDDFSAKAGVPNAYGLIGGEANSVAAGKRPLSSMTPVMVLKNKKPWLVTGSPGGSKIITANLQLVLNVIDFKMNIAEATNAPRVHHQWLPDILNVERGYPGDSINLLKGFGHNVKTSGSLGCTETIMIENGIFYGYADPRRIEGKAAGH
ncbi:MAG: gamma-glutamyltransferase [Lentisphaerales bacterium]|nr:gamma-glutamyltransferase [Lentisphaerales bacterium]